MGVCLGAKYTGENVAPKAFQAEAGLWGFQAGKLLCIGTGFAADTRDEVELEAAAASRRFHAHSRFC